MRETAPPKTDAPMDVPNVRDNALQPIDVMFEMA
jgi:hypothetical protein